MPDAFRFEFFTDFRWFRFPKADCTLEEKARWKNPYFGQSPADYPRASRLELASMSFDREWANFGGRINAGTKPMEAYRPASGKNGPERLLSEFMTVDTDKGALRFVNKYGPVFGNPDFYAGESVSGIIDLAEQCRSLHNAYQAKDKRQFKDLLRGIALPQLSAKLETGGSDANARVMLEVNSLAGFLILALAKSVSGGSLLRFCRLEGCGRPIIIPAGRRGKRSDFCDPKHSEKYFSQKRSKKG